MVTKGVLLLALVVGWYAGYTYRAWRYGETDLQSARNRIAGATRTAWQLRGWLAVAVLIVWGVADMWIHNRGG